MMVESEPKLFLIQGDVYEVEKLVGVKIVKGQKLYRVRWRGYGRESDTLEPEENLLSCQDMIQELEKKIFERKKLKKPLFTKELRRSAVIHPSTSSREMQPPDETTWSASELPLGSKDTFWRDFDEGKIGLSDKDMYSKVKERAATKTPEGVKSGEGVPKEPPVCPKVVLKRRAVGESLAFKPASFKVKPLGLQMNKKRKKYDVLRDYRRRKSRAHRKNRLLLDENRNSLRFRTIEKPPDSNVLQELRINDSEGMGKSPKVAKDAEDVMCRIAMPESSGGGVFGGLVEALSADRVDGVERWLATSSALVNCPATEDGTTPLMIAAQLGRERATQLLLQANAHKDRQNRKGETALMMACKGGYAGVARLLLEGGANFALTNAEGINVLRIINQRPHAHSRTHHTLVEHIVRVVSEFESAARREVGVSGASIRHALFPIQCFSLNEGPKYHIRFQHHAQLESPEKGGGGQVNLLFVARAVIAPSSVLCQFTADPLLKHVHINGQPQEPFHTGPLSSVYRVSGLHNGSNKVSITTAHQPQSQVKLVICAYRVHHKIKAET